MTYIDGYLIAVPGGNKEAYLRMAQIAAPVFKKHGALRVVECWGDDVKHGKVTDFYMAVKAGENEEVVFSWIEWPDKATRDEGTKKAMEDPAMDACSPDDMPFDGMRMIFGGFVPILDE